MPVCQPRRTTFSADALVIVDMQRAFVTGPGAVPSHVRLVHTIRALLDRARVAHAPVVFLQNDGEPGSVDEPFTAGWELVFESTPSDNIVRKTADDGFEGTDLQAILKRLEIQDLVICGVLSEMCVAATARAALAEGYGVVLPHDAHGTYDIPAGPGSSSVPADMAARTAEWALGNEVKICALAEDIQFTLKGSGLSGAVSAGLEE